MAEPMNLSKFSKPLLHESTDVTGVPNTHGQAKEHTSLLMNVPPSPYLSTYPQQSNRSAVQGAEESEDAQPGRRPWFVYACLLANCAMFVVSIAKNGWKVQPLDQNPLIGPSPQVLLDLGAKQANLIRGGQWWRFFSPQYLHGGLVHLAMNMIALWRMGRDIEIEFGSWRIVVIYTASGVSGIVASAIFIPQIVGVGASGALYGLIGAMFADFFHNHKAIDNRCMYLCSLVLSTAFGLALGLLPLVDNFAHVFGLICGFFIGCIVLAPKFGDCGYDPAKKKYYTCYSEWLVIGSSLFLLAWFGFGFTFLYLNKDPYNWCTFCRYLTCLDTPYWTCPSNIPMCQFQNGTATYIAPCPP